MRPVLQSRECHASSVDLAGVRHPLLLQPCLPKLPDPPTEDEIVFAAVANTRLLSEQTQRNCRTQSQAHPLPESWPEPLDLCIPAGIQVVALTGANTGGKTSCLKALVRAMTVNCIHTVLALPKLVAVFSGVRFRLCLVI